MSETKRWWERQGVFIEYQELQQGDLPHCVYASVAGAVNHLVKRSVWTPLDLFRECLGRGLTDAHFGVADVALTRVPDEIEKHHHNREWSQEPRNLDRIEGWLREGAVVILSMELRNDSVSRRGGWHMFSLVGLDGVQLQVWDTNGLRGFFVETDIVSGIEYPNGWFFMPHDKEDTLVLRPKRKV